MDWITETLTIGGFHDLTGFELLEREGVEAVLQLHNPDPHAPEIPLPLDLPNRANSE